MPEVALKVAMMCEVRAAIPLSNQILFAFSKQLIFTHVSRLAYRSFLQGCSGAVQRVLGKMPGVQNVNIDMPQQKVVVTVDDSVDPAAVKETVAKTGKATEFWQ